MASGERLPFRLGLLSRRLTREWELDLWFCTYLDSFSNYSAYLLAYTIPAKSSDKVPDRHHEKLHDGHHEEYLQRLVEDF
jgi:hypothetical protein